MTDPVVLYGTQSNGDTLPVQVDATGRLVAEGLEGPQGPQGEQGPEGPPGPAGEPVSPVKSVQHIQVDVRPGEVGKLVSISFVDPNKTILTLLGSYSNPSNPGSWFGTSYGYSISLDSGSRVAVNRADFQTTGIISFDVIEYS